MSDVFNEVDEELRKEEVNRLFRRFLPHIIGLSLIVVGSVAGYQAWNWWSAKQKAQNAEVFARASELMSDGKYNEAKQAFASISSSGPKGYAALARMQVAAAEFQAGNKVEAAKLYTEAAAEFEDPLFADLATIKAVMMVTDDLQFTDIETRLASVAAPGRPYRAIAREIIAAKAMEDGLVDRAREEYELLSFSLDTPSGTLKRAQIALSLLGPKPETKEIKPGAGDKSEETTE